VLTAGVLVLLGLAVASYGVVCGLRIRRQRRTGFRTTGTVVGQERSPDDSAVFSPVITFVDEYGNRRTFTADVNVSWQVHEIGDEVLVTYPPGYPNAPRLSSPAYTVAMVGAPLLFGAAFVAFGVIGLLLG
jgi:hypothetical protein